MTLSSAVGLALALAIAAAAEAKVFEEGKGGPQRSALALELRLWAPCCWVQTLDVHQSDVASALRSEISTRLEDGESTQAIENDLARRYGERIRAVPTGTDPRDAVPLVVGLGMLLSGIMLTILAFRWRRREEDSISSAVADDAYGAQVDEELRRL